MTELVQENWVLFLIALLIGIAIAWWIFVASRRVRVESDKRDTLDEGAERATRNQALIDAPPATAAGYTEIPPATPIGMAGAGEAVADAAEPIRRNPQETKAPPAQAPRRVEEPRETQTPADPVREDDKTRDVDVDAPSAQPVRETDVPSPPVEPAPAEPARETDVPAPKAAPAPVERASETAPVEAGGEDDLKQIKGIGPKLEQTLNSLGITSFSQIAQWDDAEIDRIDSQLGRFQGRIRRDHWVEQAAFLVSGDQAGYESRFGRV